MRTIGLIPARAGSKGVPFKNWREFHDQESLVQRATRIADEAAVFDDIVISADPCPDDRVVTAYKRVLFLDRPAHLAANDTPIKAVAEHAVEALGLEPEDVIVLLYPVYPLRCAADIRETVRLLEDARPLSIIGRVPVTEHPELMRWEDGARVIPLEEDPEPYRRQDFEPCFRLTHFHCAFRVSELPKLGPQLWNDHLTAQVAAPPDRVLDIDTWHDWHLARFMLTGAEAAQGEEAAE